MPGMSRQSRSHLFRGQWGILAVIAVGGALGAVARHALALAWPAAPDGVPWHTLVTNVSGSALLGITIVLVSEVRTAHRLVRPFLGTGVLGGFTTFSLHTDEIIVLAEHARVWAAAGYSLLTLVASLAGAWAGMRFTRAIASR